MLTFKLGLGHSGIAVDFDRLAGLPDVLKHTWVCNLIDRALIVQQQIILVHHSFRFLLYEDILTIVGVFFFFNVGMNLVFVLFVGTLLF